MDSPKGSTFQRKVEPSQKDKVAEKVAVAAVKYSMLKVNPHMQIAFDIEESVNLEGDSGPYLLYTYARCQSVFRKSKILNPKFKKNPKLKIQNYSFNPEEEMLLRLLYRFPEVVVEAAKNLSPNLICTYLFDLAQTYNEFYNKHSILGIKNKDHKTYNKEEKTVIAIRQLAEKQSLPQPKADRPLAETIEFRLFLTRSTSEVLNRGLYLLGIETVERM